MKTTNMSRRTLLRGMLGASTVTLGLPMLEAMLDVHGEALANGDPLPRRFGVWFWGNGVAPESWVPSTEGLGWEPSPILQPLVDAGVASEVTVVSGMTLPGIAASEHFNSMAGVLSGHDSAPTNFYGEGTPEPTCDQIAAQHIGGHTMFRSLELAVSRADGVAGIIDPDASAAWTTANFLPAETSPRALFERLFGLGFSPDTNELDARLSLLDTVMQDAHHLADRLGSTDRHRLEAHLDGLRAIETRLLTEPVTCTIPDEPADYPYQAGQEQLSAISDTMAELLAVALACDLARVFNLRFTHALSETVFWPAGANEGSHYMSHQNGGSGRTTYADSVRFVMERLGVLLQKLASLPEGSGSLLDQCAIMCTTELADGALHTVDDFPVLLAGRAGGALRAGIHYRGSTSQSITSVPFTALRAVGVPIDSFGTGPRQVASTLSAIEA